MALYYTFKLKCNRNCLNSNHFDDQFKVWSNPCRSDAWLLLSVQDVLIMSPLSCEGKAGGQAGLAGLGVDSAASLLFTRQSGCGAASRWLLSVSRQPLLARLISLPPPFFFWCCFGLLLVSLLRALSSRCFFLISASLIPLTPSSGCQVDGLAVPCLQALMDVSIKVQYGLWVRAKSLESLFFLLWNEGKQQSRHCLTGPLLIILNHNAAETVPAKIILLINFL